MKKIVLSLSILLVSLSLQAVHTVRTKTSEKEKQQEIIALALKNKNLSVLRNGKTLQKSQLKPKNYPQHKIMKAVIGTVGSLNNQLISF